MHLHTYFKKYSKVYVCVHIFKKNESHLISCGRAFIKPPICYSVFFPSQNGHAQSHVVSTP